MTLLPLLLQLTMIKTETILSHFIYIQISWNPTIMLETTDGSEKLRE